jgi:hypothetical protein
MASAEITRCENCTGDCNEFFVDTARALLLSDDGTEGALLAGEDRERVLKFRLHEIIGCTLTSRQVSTNLEGLIEGNLEING